MEHWYSDEIMVMQRVREIQRRADRAQAWGLFRRAEPPAWPRLRTQLGHGLIALGQYLQRGKEIRRADAASSSQCGLR